MRAMKDSGIEWIGEIPEDWKLERLKHHAELSPATVIPNYAEDDEVSFVPMDHLKSGYHLVSNMPYKKVKSGYVVFQNNDIMMAKVTPCLENGNLAIAKNLKDGIGFGSTEINVLRCCSINTEYLFYLLQCPSLIEKAKSNMFGVAGLKRLVPDFLPNSFFPMPRVDEQNQIVRFLDSKCAEIDSLISAKEKTNALLKEQRQSIIYEAVTKGLNPDAPMKNSGVEWIGEIPAGWNTLRLRFLGDFQNGISKAGEFFGSGFPFVSYSDVYKNDILPSVPSGLVRSTPEEQKLYSVEKGDFFFTRTSETKEEIGLTAVCCETISNATFAGFLIRFRPSTDRLSTEFLRYYFSCGLQREYFAKEMTLVTRASLGQDLLKNMTVLIPSREEQDTIVKYLNNQIQAIELSIEQNCVLIKQLKEYRQSIIYEAVTGKIEV